ncbi:MAG: RHS repeat-associated core domain-containing protein [Acidimicrobiales bacterium]
MLVATMAALLPMGPVRAAQTAEPDPVESSIQGVLARTETSVTTANGDGTNTVEIHQAPINYLDDAGDWQPRDDSLVPDAGGGYRRKAGPAAIHFGDDADGQVLKVSDDNWSLGFDMEDAAPGRRAQVQAKTGVRFPGVGDGVDLDYRVHGDQIKEEVIVRKRPVTGAGGAGGVGSYRFTLSLSGLTPAMSDDGTIAFSTSGKVVATIPPGVAYDSRTGAHFDGYGPATQPVRTALVDLGGGRLAVDVTVDPAWLIDPRRVYPVVIDPTVNLLTVAPSSDTSTYTTWDAYGGRSSQVNDDPAGNLIAYQILGTEYDEVTQCEHTYGYYATAHENYDLGGADLGTVTLAQWHGNIISGSGTVDVWAVGTNDHRSFSASPGRKTVDITSMVANWANRSTANAGIQFGADYQQPGEITLASEESGQGSYLTMTYQAPVRAAQASRTVMAEWDALGDGNRTYSAVLRKASNSQQVASRTIPSCGSTTCRKAEFDSRDGIVNGVGYKVEVTTGARPPSASLAVTPGATPLSGGPISPGEALGGSNLATLSLECARPKVTGNPIDPATGLFFHTFDDMLIPGRGVPLALSHTYNSDDASIATDLGLGHGWTFTYAMSLAFGDPGGGSLPSSVRVRQENGAEVTFELDTATSSYAPNAARVDATLGRNGDGTYTFTRHAAELYVFDSAGRLSELRDLNDYVTTVTHPTATSMEVTDPSGRKLTFSYEAGHVKTVTDASITPARTVTFSYDGIDDLRSVVDIAGGTTSFTYDDDHRMLTMRFPEHHGDTTTVPTPEVTNYYLPDGRVQWQTDELGRRTEFDYAPADEPAGSVLVTDPKGNKTVFRYEHGLLSSETRGYGTAEAATWLHDNDVDTAGCSAVTDPNGHTTKATYDDNGNRTSTTDALDHQTTSVYNDFNQVKSVTDPMGVTTTFTYDESWGPEAGNLTKVSTPLKNAAGVTVATRRTEYRYLEDNNTHAGEVTSMGDPNGNEWTYRYDNWGNLREVIDPLLRKTTAVYDAAGRKTSATTAEGYVSPHTPADYTTTFDYEADNLLKEVTDPLGHVSERHYDKNRNMDWALDADGRKTVHEYDAADQLVKTTRAADTPEAVTERTEYNSDGSVEHQFDADEKATTYLYDAQGRTTSVTDPNGRATKFAYDPAGNLVTKTDPGGVCTATSNVGCTRSTYDAADRLKTVDYSEPATPDITAIDYDDNGRRRSTTDGTGESSWAWDSLGRLTSSTNGAGPTGAGQTVGYTYQLGGELKEITYPGDKTVTRHFDAAGQLKWVEDWLGNRTTFDYDANGNWTDKELPNGNGVAETRTYDRADALDGIIIDKGSTNLAAFNYGRTDAGLVKSVDATGVPDDDHSYAYDGSGRLCLATTTSLATATSENCSAPPAVATRYDFDPADNLARKGPVAQTFDDAHQLTSVEGVAPSTTWGSAGDMWAGADYNGDGSADLAVYRPSTGTWFVRGNPALAAVAWGAGGDVPVPADYDGDGAADVAVFRDANATWYVRDKPALAAVAFGSPGDTPVPGDYDGDGTDDMATYKDGVWHVRNVAGLATVSYGAQGDAPVPGDYDGDGTTDIAVYRPSTGQWFVRGASPELTSYGTGPGDVAKPADYNGDGTTDIAVYRPTTGQWFVRGGSPEVTQFGAAGDDPVPADYDGDGRADVAVLRNSTIWFAEATASATFSYDNRGNRTGRSSPYGASASYGYDQANRLASARGATYAYNGNGLRMAKTIGGVTTGFTWDEAEGLPLLLSEGPASSSTRYIYGPGGLPIERVSSTGQVTYYHQDQLGSTRVLTDGGGNVTATSTFDAYGTMVGSTGASSSQPFGFAGQYTDAETGFVYLRARYYDPATGQFLTRDPIEAVTREPYGYVGGNPLNATDPSGLACAFSNGDQCLDLGDLFGFFRSDASKKAKAVGRYISDNADAIGEIASHVEAVALTVAVLCGPTPCSGVAMSIAGVASGTELLASLMMTHKACKTNPRSQACAEATGQSALNFAVDQVQNRLTRRGRAALAIFKNAYDEYLDCL